MLKQPERSVPYWHPFLYELFIRFSFGKGYRERYEALQALIPDGASVTDVCCGDCKIFEFLKGKGVRYVGLDFNPAFVNIARSRGIDARIFNVFSDDLPRSDYVLLQGSLYQFYPRHGDVLRKLYDAAGKYLIISEPIKNNADSASKIVSSLSKALNDPGDGVKAFRFRKDTLVEALVPFSDHIEKEFASANGMEYIAVIRKG